MATGLPAEAETIGVLDDGSRLTVHIHAFPTFAANGQANGFIEVVEDITERKRAEEDLRESEEKYRLLVKQIPAVVFKGYADWSIDFFDDKVEVLTGYPKEDFDSRRLKWLDLIIPDDQPGGKAKFIKALKTNRSYVREYRIRKKSGEIAWIQAMGQIFLDAAGQIDFISGVFMDNTARKQAEEELGESLRRNQLILDSLPSAALLIRADFTIMVSNQAAALAGAVLGQPCYSSLWGFAAPCPWCKAQEALQTGKPLQAEIEAAGKVWDSHWIPINSDLFLHFVYDITELKEAEQERAKLRERLFQAQKMEAIGTLAGGIAHDFNNILSAIIGYGEMLDLFHSAECPQIKPDLKEILKGAFRAKDLVQQILTFSRKTKRDRKPLNLLLVIKESLKFLRASLPSTIKIIQSLDPEVGPVLADPTQMQQVVMNLCTNAAHAMRERGGVLEVRLTEVVIGERNGRRVLKLSPGLYARLTVKDSGHGIPPEILARIFDPYFTTKGMGEGTGLGLAVVEGIVQSHGGAITVESEPGSGTVFQVFIPILERTEIDLTTVTTTQIPKGQGRVLFVDDEPALTDMARQILKILGYEVEALTSSPTALNHFLQHPQQYDLAILDLTMPQMTGVELAREILQIRPDLPIILTTGVAEQLSQEELKKAGIGELLKKPFRVRTLAETIKKVLG
jgi:PAS domain S-box-containing protein